MPKLKEEGEIWYEKEGIEMNPFFHFNSLASTFMMLVYIYIVKLNPQLLTTNPTNMITNPTIYDNNQISGVVIIQVK